MKERPILFSGEMVRAILEGRKTQTRRVIKPQPPEGFIWGGWIIATTGDRRDVGKASWESKTTFEEHAVKCPYGEPDDRLWVRETWQIMMPCTVSWGSGEDDWDFESAEAEYIPASKPDFGGPLLYKADDPSQDVRWRPSIFMPRWASRITLEIVSIRVERLQEITEEDAIAEGIPYEPEGNAAYHRYHYMLLWDSINAKRGYSWASNPWVWVIEFKRVEVGA